ncbi:hypothetical protein QYM36_015063 [Artemia franciscana]|uniref:Uncharacterized protein n=1 Tax=Artemia franciscana TaxID=6661 RepID=A0AA88KU87_ARTSF|nr:hypothetical protein QYM36_015063 [Artemia franciscana]
MAWTELRSWEEKKSHITWTYPNQANKKSFELSNPQNNAYPVNIKQDEPIEVKIQLQIDIAMAGQRISIDKVLEISVRDMLQDQDVLISDHQPILTHTNQSNSSQNAPKKKKKFIIRKPDYLKLKKEMTPTALNLPATDGTSTEEKVAIFQQIILEISQQSIPMSNGKPKKYEQKAPALKHNPPLNFKNQWMVNDDEKAEAAVKYLNSTIGKEDPDFSETSRIRGRVRELSAKENKEDYNNQLTYKELDLVISKWTNAIKKVLSESKGELSLTKYILELNANPNLKLSRSHWTPLHYASIKGNLEISQLLVSNGATVDAFTSDGGTPLGWSVIEREVSVTKYLLEQGANPNLEFDQSQCTPLHYAAKDGELEICHLLLLSGALMDALDASKWTPLHSAARYGNLEICRLLISSGAAVIALDDYKWTPIHYAARYNKLDICQLLASNGAEINCLTSKNDTPLMLAYCNVNDIYSYISEYLLANKAKLSDEIMRFMP